MRTKLLLTAIAATLLIAQSCNKNTSFEPEFYTDPTSLVNVSNYGWLQFDNPDHLNSVLEQLTKSDSAYEANHDSWIGSIDDSYTQEQIDSIFETNNYTPDYVYTSFENNQTGFVSLRHQYDFLQDAYLATCTEVNIDDFPDHELNYRGINSVVNSKGEYQVGDYVVFNLPEDISFMMHIDSISSDKISEIRSLEKSNFNNVAFKDTIVDYNVLDSIYQGDADQPELFGVIITLSVGTIVVYVTAATVDYLDGFNNNPDCRKNDKEVGEQIVGTQHKFICKTKFKRLLFGSHRSMAKIIHIENINGKEKRTKANMGLMTYSPYMWASEDCATGNFKFDRNFPLTHEINKKFSHVDIMPTDPSNPPGLSNPSSNNDVKILKGVRYTDFYYNGTKILTLTNVW